MKLKGCVVTVASGKWRGYHLFRKSCARNNIRPIVLGWGKSYRTHVKKILWLNGFLKSDGKKYSHVLFCDAYDVVIGADWRRLFKTFLSFDAPLVFSAERRCWPDESLAKKFPRSPTPYRFLNSGLWMGEIDAARNLIEEILRDEISPDNFSDQRLYTKAFLKCVAPIALDYRCKLFQSLYKSSDDLSWNQKKRRIQNKITKQFPLVFHGNGRSNLFLPLERLKLLPPPKIIFEKAVRRGSMSENQYRFAAKLIQSLQSRRILVIGAGHDTDFWYQRSHGNMACVENKAEWFTRLPCDLIYPNYQGTVGKWLKQIEIPKSVERPWDIVIVDGPEVHLPDSIGRQEPIAWAARFARGFVIVNNYERDWERRLCDHYLGAPVKIIPFHKRKQLLAVFNRK